MDLQRLLIDNRLTQESDLYSTQCTFKNLVLLGNETNDKSIEVEEMLVELKSHYLKELKQLKDYKTMKTRPLVHKAIFFAAYWDP